MRCYMMRAGHIACVRELPGLDDQSAINYSQRLFAQQTGIYDGFEVWDLSRMVVQYPKPTPTVAPDPPSDADVLQFPKRA
jgi:hypothetical protein